MWEERMKAPGSLVKMRNISSQETLTERTLAVANK
jgi:hypothetical protein